MRNRKAPASRTDASVSADKAPMTRKEFLLLSSAGSLLSLAGESSAAPRPKRVRTKLPSDGCISVYVGIKGTWQSLVDSKLPPVKFEIPTDVSAYDLTETPNRDNFDNHYLVGMPLAVDPKWYVFRPTSGSFTLTFNIADAKKRLGKIVVTDLFTGKVLGSLKAAQDGLSITGQLTLHWNHAFYRIDGYTASGSPLFRAAASNGRPDTYMYFTEHGEFAPNRPAAISSARFTGGDEVVGTEGDPYSPHGVVITGNGSSAYFSEGCAARDVINDSELTSSVRPPTPYQSFVKQKCIESVHLGSYLFEEQANAIRFDQAVAAAIKEDHTPALSDITVLPYSNSTCHWTAHFRGEVTAYFLIPYRVTHHDDLQWKLCSQFGTFYKAMVDVHDNLSFGLMAAFIKWLATDAGKKSGLNAGMVKALGDVKIVYTHEVLKAMPHIIPIFEDVMFECVPDYVPESGRGYLDIRVVGTSTQSTPPGPANGGFLTITSSKLCGTMKLAKGYKWEVKGVIASGYNVQQISQTVKFNTPMHKVEVPLKLTVLVTLKIITVSTAHPAPPNGIHVKITNSAGVKVFEGDSTLQADGQYALSASPVTGFVPGAYTITANLSTNAGSWAGTSFVSLQRGLLQETTLKVDYTPLHK